MTKSTLNTKMKVVDKSTIQFMTSPGKNMSKAVGTSESNGIEGNVYVGFRQPSRAATANPYQIQYKVRYRYTAANAKKHNAEYSSTWANTPWRNAREFTIGSTRHKVGENDSVLSVNEWGKANKPVNTAGSYATFINLSGTKVASGYVAAQYLFRIRTYNKKKNQHGNWSISSTLTVHKAAYMIDEVIHRDVDGSMMFDMNYKWDTGGKFYIEEIKDANGESILINKVAAELDVDSDRTALTSPPLRSGYVAGEYHLPIENMARAIEFGERLQITAYYQTTAGKVRTYWKNKIGAWCNVSNQDLVIDPPYVTLTQNKSTGIVTARMWKGQEADAVTAASFSCSYSLNGKTVKCTPISKKGTAASLHQYSVNRSGYMEAVYMLPLNCKVTFKATLKSSYHSKTASTTKTVIQDYGPIIMLSKESNWKTIVGVMGRNVENDESASYKMTCENVFGRTLPFGVYGEAMTNTITIKGQVTDDWDSVIPATRTTNNTASIEAWKKIKANPGKYILRTSDGDVRKVLLKSVQINRSRTDRATVSVSMNEVE